MKNMQRKREKTEGTSAGSIAFSFVLVIASSCYMPLFMYFINAEEARFLDICPFLLAFSAGALVLMLLMALYTKSFPKSSLIAAIAVLLFTNYALLEAAVKVIPIHLRYWHIVLLLLFIFVHIVFLIKAKLTAESVRLINAVVLSVVLLLTLMNGAMAVPDIVEKVTYRSAQQEAAGDAQQGSVDTEGMPNIYYFIFDEFSAKDVMEKYYNFSNEEFFAGLEDLGFVVSYDSKNMSYATITVTANYVSYNYVATDNDSATARNDIRLNNPTIALMQEQGYQVKGVGAEVFGIGGSDFEVTATTQGGKTIQDLVLENTALYVLNNANQIELIKKINKEFEYFQDAEQFLGEGAQYTMVYVACPHEPFLFNEDGTMVNPKNYYNWEDKEYYLAQYKYIAGRILETMDNIIKSDPTAVIILQSDHSARWMSSIQAEDKTHILNAVYYGGERFDDFLGKSGVNTLRTVYGSLFQMDLPDVEVIE